MYSRYNQCKMSHILNNDIVGIVSTYLGYTIPVAKAWIDPIYDDSIVNVWMCRSRNISVMIEECIPEQVNFAMKYIDRFINMYIRTIDGILIDPCEDEHHLFNMYTDIILAASKMGYVRIVKYMVQTYGDRWIRSYNTRICPDVVHKYGLLGHVFTTTTPVLDAWEDMALAGIIGGSVGIVQYVIGMNVGVKLRFISTMASFCGKIEVIKYMNTLYPTNWNDIAVYAAAGDNIDILKWSVEMGANDLNRIAVSARSRFNIEPLKYAIEMGANDWNRISDGYGPGIEYHNNDRCILVTRKYHLFNSESHDVDATNRRYIIYDYLDTCKRKAGYVLAVKSSDWLKLSSLVK